MIKQKFDNKEVEISDSENENPDEFDENGLSDVDQEDEDNEVVHSSNSIVKAVFAVSSAIKNFTFDKTNYSWCQLEFEVSFNEIY